MESPDNINVLRKFKKKGNFSRGDYALIFIKIIKIAAKLRIMVYKIRF